MVGAVDGRRPGGELDRLGVIFLAVAVGLALAGVIANLASRPFPEPILAEGPLSFDGDRALALTTEFVTLFPERSVGNPGKAGAAEWLVSKLAYLGYSPQQQVFGAWVAGVYHHDLANVFTVKPGRTPEAVLVHAHYDIPPFVLQGAADDGSGVGALLELARVFAARETEKTILFVFFDGSEYGLTGSRAFLDVTPYPGPVTAVVGLDFLNVGEMAGISVEAIGTQRGYTPPWLRSLALAAAARSGEAYGAGVLAEWVERSVPVAPTDTGTFLRAGVPAVNLAGVPREPALERAVYHTPADIAANLEAASFERWGRAAELLVSSLDRLSRPAGGAAGSMTYLGLPDGRYLPGPFVRAVQLLAFTPLWTVTLLSWVERRRAAVAAWAVFRAEARRLLAAAACLLAGLLTLKLLAVSGALPRYDLYPATPKDPFLYSPDILPLLAAAAVSAGTALAVGRLTGWFRPPLAADWLERRHALTTLLAASVLPAWLFGGGFAAVTFLAPAAFLWLFLAEPAGRFAGLRRALNLLLLAGGLVPFGALLVLFPEVYLTGPAWWYLLLGAAYGLLPLRTLLAASVVAALHLEAFALGTGLGAGRLVPTGPALPVPLVSREG